MKTKSHVKIQHPLGTITLHLVTDVNETKSALETTMKNECYTFSSTSSQTDELIMVSGKILRESFITITPVNE